MGVIAKSILGFIPEVGAIVGDFSELAINETSRCDPNVMRVQQVMADVDARLSAIAGQINKLNIDVIKSRLEFYGIDAISSTQRIDMGKHAASGTPSGSISQDGTFSDLAKDYMSLAVIYSSLTNRLRDETSIFFMAAAYDLGLAQGILALSGANRLVDIVMAADSQVSPGNRDIFIKGFVQFTENYVFFLNTLAKRWNDLLSFAFWQLPFVVVDKYPDVELTAPQKTKGANCSSEVPMRVRFKPGIGTFQYHIQAFGSTDHIDSLASAALQGKEIALVGSVNNLSAFFRDEADALLPDFEVATACNGKAKLDDLKRSTTDSLNKDIAMNIMTAPADGSIEPFAKIHDIWQIYTGLFRGIDPSALDQISKRTIAYLQGEKRLNYHYDPQSGTGWQGYGIPYAPSPSTAPSTAPSAAP